MHFFFICEYLLQMTVSSLKEKATMANIVRVRTQLFRSIDRITTSPLDFFTQSGNDIYDKNLVVLSKIVSDLKALKKDWSSDWHDSQRWKQIILNNLNEAEHFEILLDSSLSDHFSDFHLSDSHCPCWKQLSEKLRHEVGYLRSRLF